MRSARRNGEGSASDTEGNFRPYYVIPNDKKKYVQACARR